MMAPKNITVADDSGQFSAIEGIAWRGEFPALVFRAAFFGRSGPQLTETVVSLDEAKRVGEWLLAWAREQGPTCCYCKAQVPQGDAKAVGQDFAHQKCVDDQLNGVLRR